MFEIRCSLPLNSSKSSFKNITGLRLSRELSVLKVKTDMLVKGMYMLKEMMYKLQNQPAIAEVYKQYCSINHVTDGKQGEDLSMASKSESGDSSSSSALSTDNKKVIFLDSKFVTYLYSNISDKSLSAKVKHLMSAYLHTLTKLSLYQKDLSKLVDKIVALK